jgi:hypothetical protein
VPSINSEYNWNTQSCPCPLCRKPVPCAQNVECQHFLAEQYHSQVEVLEVEKWELLEKFQRVCVPPVPEGLEKKLKECTILRCPFEKYCTHAVTVPPPMAEMLFRNPDDRLKHQGVNCVCTMYLQLPPGWRDSNTYKKMKAHVLKCRAKIVWGEHKRIPDFFRNINELDAQHVKRVSSKEYLQRSLRVHKGVSKSSLKLCEIRKVQSDDQHYCAEQGLKNTTLIFR